MREAPNRIWELKLASQRSVDIDNYSRLGIVANSEPDRERPSDPGLELARWLQHKEPIIAAGIEARRASVVEIAAAADWIWYLYCLGWDVERMQHTQRQLAALWKRRGKGEAVKLLQLGKAIRGPKKETLRGPIVQTSNYIAISQWDVVLRRLAGNRQFRSWVNNMVTDENGGIRRRVVKKFLQLYDCGENALGRPSDPADKRRRIPKRAIFDQCFADYQRRQFFSSK